MSKKKQSKDSPQQKMIKVKVKVTPPTVIPARTVRLPIREEVIPARKVRVKVREEVMVYPVFYIDRTAIND
jgi:hypothetical protein